MLGTGNYREITEVIKLAYQGEKTVSYGKLDETDYLDEERGKYPPVSILLFKDFRGM